jgi:hypothetical protein
LGHDPTISAAVLLADTPTWAGIQGRVVLGWIARAEGKNDDALQSLATLKEFEKGEDARAQLLRKDRPNDEGIERGWRRADFEAAEQEGRKRPLLFPSSP